MENKYIVFEYTEKASPHYHGARYMTSDEGQPIIEAGNVKVVARGLNETDAYALLNVTVEKNIEAHLSEMPDELRDPISDAFIANMIRNGTKR
jgi:hypothetical protein